MGDALTYEYLIRRIYNVGRYGKPGADADEWRSLERSISHLRSEKELMQSGRPSQWRKSIDELEIEASSKLAKIKMFISKALTDSTGIFSKQFSKSDQQFIQDKLNTLKGADFERTCELIEETTNFFVEKEIFPG